jgi:hypothetical protein
MPAKPNARNWNDVQTAIATAAIVTTLGMWNLFATPEKTAAAQAQEPKEPSPTLPPTEPPVTPEPTMMPQVKIMFTQMPTQTTNVVQQSQQETKKKKKKKKDNDNGGGGGGGGSASVTQTQSS